MTIHNTVSRRSFLQSSALATGGLMLGFVLPDGAGIVQAAATVHTPNAWVHIADDNTITVLCARAEMGQGVYTALPMLVAEELNVELRSVKVAIAPAGAAYKNALLGAQITGGSSSVRDGWETLRIAGAQVREMLVSAAAAKWKVDRSSLTASKGMVTGPGGRKATYGELAAAASKLPVPEKVALKDPAKFTIVGKRTPRLDTPLKVNGKAEFGIDVKLPGMVYAALEQCPVIGGKVKTFDASKAKAMAGVLDVVAIPDGVAVVADTWYHAKKAREALAITWDEGAGAGIDDRSMLDGIRAAAASENAMLIAPAQGDVDATMQKAAKVVKAEYVMPLLAHSTLEPMNFTADVSNGKCLLVGPTQFQQGAVGAVASALGIKPEDITLKTTFLGGGFGRRLELDYIVQAAQISKAVNKPVKLLWTREDDTTHDFYRPMSLTQMEAALDSAGKPQSLHFKVTSQSVTQRAFGLPKDKLDDFMVEAAIAPYSVPATRHEVVAHDPGLRGGYWRAVSHNMNVFANESFIDELAVAAGKDPVAYRLSLLDGRPRLQHVLKIAAEKAGWGRPAPAGHARGVALLQGYDTSMAQVAEISMKDGVPTVHKVTVVADLGRMVNPDTVEAQIQSSIVFGLTAALFGEITLEKGRVKQTNFHEYRLLRMNEVPKMDITLVSSTEKPGGIGEPATSLIGPAVANAIFAATGKRVRRMPFTMEGLRAA
jgi:isoquinoline 1-oxidoreductase beta subunit